MGESDDKPRLLVISHVLPVDGHAGQQMRVRNKLKGLCRYFHITFLTISNSVTQEASVERLRSFVDELVILPSLYQGSIWSKVYHRFLGRWYGMIQGIRWSNYILGKVELTGKRIEEAVEVGSFDLVLYEYWHAVDSVPIFQTSGVLTILDMHNVLWRVLERNLLRDGSLSAWRKRLVSLYKEGEETGWGKFDGLIAINRNELAYVVEQVPVRSKVFYTPMGVEIEQLAYVYKMINDEPRLAYYGGLSSHHNCLDAIRCAKEIMPLIWLEHETAELWIIGANPPQEIRSLALDSRVKVLGYVADLEKCFSGVDAMLCPWIGKYGFRSRIVESMALGVPVISTADAVDGMELRDGDGILFRETNEEISKAAIGLINDRSFAEQLSRRARDAVVRLYGFEATYGSLARNLVEWVHEERDDRKSRD